MLNSCAVRRSFRYKPFALCAALLACVLSGLLASHLHAQDKGEPGRFDFYLMNIAAGADFCHVPGAGPQCKPPREFRLHGLWTQNNNGSYPVNCSQEPGPADYRAFLDLTPDLPLLQHEWEKHGTCTGVGPERFFAMERQAYGMLRLPAEMKQPAQERTVTTDDLLRDLQRLNPGFPQGSLLLSCREGKLTAVEACFSKDLKPIRCTHLPTCANASLRVEP